MIKIVAERTPTMAKPSGRKTLPVKAVSPGPTLTGEVKDMVSQFKQWCSEDENRKKFLDRNRQIEVLLEALINVDSVWTPKNSDEKNGFKQAISSMLSESAKMIGLVLGNVDSEEKQGDWKVLPGGVVSEEMLVNLFYIKHIPYNCIVSALDMVYKADCGTGLVAQLSKIDNQPAKVTQSQATETNLAIGRTVFEAVKNTGDDAVNRAADRARELTKGNIIDQEDAKEIIRQYKKDKRFNKLSANDQSAALNLLLQNISKKLEVSQLRDEIAKEILALHKNDSISFTKDNSGEIDISNLRSRVIDLVPSTATDDTSIGQLQESDDDDDANLTLGQKLWSSLVSGYSSYGSRYNNVGPFERFLSLLVGSDNFPTGKGSQGDGDIVLPNGGLLEVKYMSNSGLDAVPTVGNSKGCIIFFSLTGNTIDKKKTARDVTKLGYVILTTQWQIQKIFPNNRCKGPEVFKALQAMWNKADIHESYEVIG